MGNFGLVALIALIGYGVFMTSTLLPNHSLKSWSTVIVLLIRPYLLLFAETGINEFERKKHSLILFLFHTLLANVYTIHVKQLANIVLLYFWVSRSSAPRLQLNSVNSLRVTKFPMLTGKLSQHVLMRSSIFCCSQNIVSSWWMEFSFRYTLEKGSS